MNKELEKENLELKLLCNKLINRNYVLEIMYKEIKEKLANIEALLDKMLTDDQKKHLDQVKNSKI